MLLKFHRDILFHHLAAITATAVVVAATATSSSVEEWVPNSLLLLDDSNDDDDDDRVGNTPFNGNNNAKEEEQQEEKELTTTNVNHHLSSYNKSNKNNQLRNSHDDKNDTTTTVLMPMSIVDLGKLSTTSSRRELGLGKCENRDNYLFKKKKNRDCDKWVAKKRKQRCKKKDNKNKVKGRKKRVSFFCPEICNQECSPSISEAPTVTPIPLGECVVSKKLLVVDDNDTGGTTETETVETTPLNFLRAKDFFNNKNGGYGNDYNAKVKNQGKNNEYIECKNCTNLIFQDCSVTCITDYYACSYATFLSTGESDKNNGLEILCDVANGCKKATFNGTVDNNGDMDMKVLCTLDRACYYSEFNNIYSVTCGFLNDNPNSLDLNFCNNAKMNNIQTDVICTGKTSCKEAIISNVGNNILCGGYLSCSEGTFTNITNNIDCTFQRSCESLNINYVNNVYCRKYSQFPMCESIFVSNAEYVYCGPFGAPSTPYYVGTCSGFFGTKGQVKKLQCYSLGCVNSMTYDVGTVVCDGDYSCYGSYLNGVRESVLCSGERACADIATTAGGTYFVISPFNNDGNIFDRGFNGTSTDDYSDGITVTCDRKSNDGESVCGYFYEFLYSPETLSRTKIDVGVNGKLICEADFNGKYACEYIAFGGLNKTKNAQCSNVKVKNDSARRIFIRPDDFDSDGNFIFPKDPATVEVCVGPDFTNAPTYSPM